MAAGLGEFLARDYPELFSFLSDRNNTHASVTRMINDVLGPEFTTTDVSVRRARTRLAEEEGSAKSTTTFSEEDRTALHDRLDVILDRANLDPGQVKGLRVSQWDGMTKDSDNQPVVTTLYGVNLNVREFDREQVQRVPSLDELALIRTYPALGSYSPAVGTRPEGTLVVALGDLQVGKVNAESGTAELWTRLRATTAEVVKHIHGSGRKPQRIVLMHAGDCLAAETEIVTRAGIQKIGDLAGRWVNVRDAHGGWVNVEIRSYGVKPIVKVTWRSRQAEKVVYTSPGHEWIVANDKGGLLERVRADELQPGMRTFKSARPTPNKHKALSPAGVQAGFIFGDGTVEEAGSRAGFYGDKDAAMLRWFPEGSAYPDARGDLRTNAIFPRSWKISPPEMCEGSAYLFGWLAGYFAADGCVDQNGGAILSSARRENLDTVRSICAVLGIDTWPIRETSRIGIGQTIPSSLYTMALSIRSLPDEFFLISAHRDRVVAARARNEEKVNWYVESVKATERVEETFCCVVPTTKSFMLADGLLTSNCIEGITSQGGRLIKKQDMYLTSQVDAYQRMVEFQVLELAPLCNVLDVAVVPGNHDETTRQFEVATEDSWAIFGAKNAQRFIEASGRYSNISWHYPEHDKLAVEFDAGDLEHGPFYMTMVHGHKIAKNANTVMDWWRRATFGNQPGALSRILVTGHFHHYRSETGGDGRTWLQVPAMDGGSAWFANSKGDDTPPGMVTFWLDQDKQYPIRNLIVHSEAVA